MVFGISIYDIARGFILLLYSFIPFFLISGLVLLLPLARYNSLEDMLGQEIKVFSGKRGAPSVLDRRFNFLHKHLVKAKNILGIISIGLAVAIYLVLK